MAVEKKLILACDLGGTKTSVALIDVEGTVLFEARQPTPHTSARGVIESVVNLSEELTAGASVAAKSLLGVAVGVPGMIDYRKGLVVFSPHLPFRNTPVKKMLKRHFSVPVFVDNDANLAALGEHSYGAGRGVKNMLMVTVGTGIGGGIIIDGRLYRGATGSAAEFGHMVIDLNGPKDDCGNYGCLEVMASGDSIGALARQELLSHSDSRILEFADKPKKVTGEDVSAAAAAGDKLAKQILERIGTLLGAGLTNLVNIFNPELIVLGGGVMEGDSIVAEAAKKQVAAKALIPNRDVVKIVTSKLGHRASLLGGAALVLAEID